MATFLTVFYSYLMFEGLTPPFQLHDLVPTRSLLIQKLPAPLFKACKRDTTGLAACVCSLVLFSLLLNDSCLNDNPCFFFLFVFCLYSPISLTLISKWGQLIHISFFLPKLMRRLRGSPLPSGKQKFGRVSIPVWQEVLVKRECRCSGAVINPWIEPLGSYDHVWCLLYQKGNINAH